MTHQPERIPVPWPQRWELLRERALPVLCFVATLAACGWLWRYQSTVAPVALGEVRGAMVVVKSPCNGELLSAVVDGDDAFPLFAEVEKGAVAARVKDADNAGQIIEVPAPLTGQVAAMIAHVGEFVQRGDPLLAIASPQPAYIVCHVPDHGQGPPAVGADVAIRRQVRGARWTPAVVEAVGPALEPPPPLSNGAMNGVVRGLPIRIALPKDLALPPGSLVDVRFPPAAL